MRYKNVKITGPIGKADWAKETSIMVDGLLNRAGTDMAALMRQETKPHNFRGTLTDSIAWRTAKTSSKIKNTEHLIDAPPLGSVDIGSAAPHAKWREFGAGPHQFPNGSAEFIKSMKEWFREKVGGNPDGSKADKIFFWKIVNSIRYGDKAVQGIQNQEPFIAPVEKYKEAIAKQAGISALAAMWARLERKYKA
jgi:hypothetical protein